MAVAVAAILSAAVKINTSSFAVSSSRFASSLAPADLGDSDSHWHSSVWVSRYVDDDDDGRTDLGVCMCSCAIRGALDGFNGSDAPILRVHVRGGPWCVRGGWWYIVTIADANDNVERSNFPFTDIDSTDNIDVFYVVAENIKNRYVDDKRRSLIYR